MKYRLIGAIAAAVCCTAAPGFAQGLSRVEVMGLQQQLRDDGCGVKHVTGRIDATTRSAVRKCQSKYPDGGDPASMLAAMNIGFGNGIPVPTLAAARAGNGGSMSVGGTSGLMDERSQQRDTTDTIDLNNAAPVTVPTPPVIPETPPTDSTLPPTLPQPTLPQPPAPPNPPAPPDLPIPPRDTSAIPRDTSTIPRDTSSIPMPDTMPLPQHDTVPSRDTMPNTH